MEGSACNILTSPLLTVGAGRLGALLCVEVVNDLPEPSEDRGTPGRIAESFCSVVDLPDRVVSLLVSVEWPPVSEAVPLLLKVRFRGLGALVPGRGLVVRLFFFHQLC